MCPRPEDVIFNEEDLYSQPLIDPNFQIFERVNIQDDDGNTPLHRAAAQNNHAEVARLIGSCANIFIKNNAGQEPLTEYARSILGVENLWAIKETAQYPTQLENLIIRQKMVLHFSRYEFDAVKDLFKYACRKGYDDSIKRFLMTSSSNHHYTILMVLAGEQQEHANLMKLMIDRSTTEMLTRRTTHGISLVDILKANSYTTTLQYLARKHPAVYSEPDDHRVPARNTQHARRAASVTASTRELRSHDRLIKRDADEALGDASMAPKTVKKYKQ